MEWGHALVNHMEKRKLERKLVCSIERHIIIAGSGIMDIEAYLQRMQVPCNPYQYMVKVPHGLHGLWGDSHVLHCLVDALGIAVVTIAAGPRREAWIFGKKGVSLENQGPKYIVYLQHDGYSHYNTLLPKEGDMADTLIRQVMAGELHSFVTGTSGTPGRHVLSIITMAKDVDIYPNKD